MSLQIGLLDSGIDGHMVGSIADSAEFKLDNTDNVVQGPSIGDLTGHGTRIAQIIQSAGTDIALLSAQVFSDRGASSPAVVAAGLTWLVSAGAQVVTMSFGVVADRPVLRDACRCALEGGVILVASSPPRGRPVYPAAYDGVISASGDARCAPQEHSYLASSGALFGACVHPPGDKPGVPGLSGSSIAAAYMTCAIAGILRSQPVLTVEEVIQTLIQNCDYRGVEKRTH